MRIDIYVRKSDEEMFERARIEAEKRRTSLSKLLADLLEEWLRRQEKDGQ